MKGRLSTAIFALVEALWDRTQRWKFSTTNRWTATAWMHAEDFQKEVNQIMYKVRPYARGKIDYDFEMLERLVDEVYEDLCNLPWGDE